MTDASRSEQRREERRERLDDLFTALADERRCQVVRYFESADDDVASITELVEFSIEDAPTQPTRDELEIAFHHVTLPKLAELGIVEYDTRSRTVRYRGTPTLERVLIAVRELELSTK